LYPFGPVQEYVVFATGVHPFTLSVAVGFRQEIAPLFEHVAVGAGRMVTVKLHVPVLPHASVAVTVTVVVPIGNTLPEAIEKFGVTGPQLSVAVAE
jgi:hypothetical protein